MQRGRPETAALHHRETMNTSDNQRTEVRLRGTIDRVRHFLEHEQWTIDIGTLSPFRALGVRMSRVLTLAWESMVRNECTTRASALTYITVLSLVPLLAFAFSVAKGFGAYERLVETTITPFLDQLAPGTLTTPGTGEGAAEIRNVVEGLLSFVSNTSFANLGLLGLTFLIIAALRLMVTVESVFNLIWGLQRARPLVRKVTDFVAIVVITPILLLVATTVTVSLQSNLITDFLTTTLRLGVVVGLLSRLIPLIMVWLGFAALYMIMPNTRVPPVSALMGGIVAGTLWQVVQVLHVQFQIGVASYNAIYAGFAALPLFLVWVYMNWVVILLGGVVAWAHQTQPVLRQQRRTQVTSAADRELLALRALLVIGRSFAENQGAVPTAVVAAQCGVPAQVLEDALQPLVRAGLVGRTDDGQEPGFLPARALSQIRVSSVVRALRGERHDHADAPDDASLALDQLHQAMETSPDDRSLEELTRAAGSRGDDP